MLPFDEVGHLPEKCLIELMRAGEIERKLLTPVGGIFIVMVACLWFIDRSLKDGGD
jgi:hypothetical protein